MKGPVLICHDHGVEMLVCIRRGLSCHAGIRGTLNWVQVDCEFVKPTKGGVVIDVRPGGSPEAD